MISKRTDFVSSTIEILDVSEGTRRQSRHTPVWRVLPTPYSRTNTSCRICVDYLKYKPFVTYFNVHSLYSVYLFIFFSQSIIFIDEIVIIIYLQYLLTL